MTAREEWRWTDERGVQRLVGADELRAALASGQLPGTTLVWRDGLKSWVPAHDRPELANAVAIGQAIRGRSSASANEGDRRTPTGLMPAKGAGKAASKLPELPGNKRPTAPPLPARGATRTLQGIPSPVSDKLGPPPAPGAPAGQAAPRAGATKIPERGVPPEANAVVPKAPAVPAGLGVDARRGERKLTTREIDGEWGSEPVSDEGPTHPSNNKRDPLPSFELPLTDDPPAAERDAQAAQQAAPRPKPPLPGGKPAGASPAKAPASSAAVPASAVPVSSTAVAPVGNGAAKPAPPRPGGAPAAAAAGPAAAKPKPPPLPGRQNTATMVAAGVPANTDKTTSTPAVVVVQAPAPAAQAPAAAPVIAAVAQVAPVPAAVEARVEAHAARHDVPQEDLSSTPLPSFPDESEIDPLGLPPPRAAVPSQGGASGPNGSAKAHRPASLPPAHSSRDATGLALPPAALRPAPLPAIDGAGARPSEPPVHHSEPPRAFSEPPPAPGGDVPVAVPMSSLFGAGGALIAMVVAAFFAGRHSAQPTRLVARPMFHLVPLVAKSMLPPPLKPCWVARQPAMWAPRVHKSIPFDMVATPAGNLAIGYAREETDAVGIEVTPATGEVKVRFTQRGSDPLDRVVPLGTEFKVSPAAGASGFTSFVHVPGASPFVAGVKAGGLAVADRLDAPAQALFPLPGDDAPAALRVLPAGPKGHAITFRRDGAVWGTWLDPSRKAAGGLVKVPGSGGAVGKPSSGYNQAELAVIFADKPEGGERWEIRVGRAPAGQIPTSSQVVPLPKGGPGGDAFAPDIAGLPDGRWLMIWTEGAAGSRAVRAQTFAPDLTPLGDPIALSPPAGNFGQGGIGIASGYAAAVFLSKGSLGFELWGSILQCG
ncbi:MAG: GYF domain-containing protein [Byssovorax sp.]